MEWRLCSLSQAPITTRSSRPHEKDFSRFAPAQITVSQSPTRRGAVIADRKAPPPATHPTNCPEEVVASQWPNAENTQHLLAERDGILLDAWDADLSGRSPRYPNISVNETTPWNQLRSHSSPWSESGPVFVANRDFNVLQQFLKTVSSSHAPPLLPKLTSADMLWATGLKVSPAKQTYHPVNNDYCCNCELIRKQFLQGIIITEKSYRVYSFKTIKSAAKSRQLPDLHFYNFSLISSVSVRIHLSCHLSPLISISSQSLPLFISVSVSFQPLSHFISFSFSLVSFFSQRYSSFSLLFLSSLSNLISVFGLW